MRIYRPDYRRIPIQSTVRDGREAEEGRIGEAVCFEINTHSAVSPLVDPSRPSARSPRSSLLFLHLEGKVSLPRISRTGRE